MLTCAHNIDDVTPFPRPFEFVDMCNAAGIEPVMTTTGVCDACTAEDMGDLVDYCHGGANTTWGARRIADGW